MADRRFGWLQFDASDEMKGLLKAATAFLHPDDLTGDKIEDDPHVTALYGLDYMEPQVIRDAVAGMWPAPWALGRLSVFKNKKAHVLKFEVTGEPLAITNRTLAKRIRHKPSAFGFNPHLTVAYLKPGAAEKYLATATVLMGMQGLRSAGDVLTYHSKDRQRHEIPL